MSVDVGNRTDLAVKRGETMLKRQGCSVKQIEKLLFAVCGQETRENRASRKYIKSMARHVVAAYEYGRRDGARGAEAITKEESERQIQEMLSSADNPNLVADACRSVYQFYMAGYAAGKLGGK